LEQRILRHVLGSLERSRPLGQLTSDRPVANVALTPHTSLLWSRSILLDRVCLRGKHGFQAEYLPYYYPPQACKGIGLDLCNDIIVAIYWVYIANIRGPCKDVKYLLLVVGLHCYQDIPNGYTLTSNIYIIKLLINRMWNCEKVPFLKSRCGITSNADLKKKQPIPISSIVYPNHI
jgi:hypothetical protein